MVDEVTDRDRGSEIVDFRQVLPDVVVQRQQAAVREQDHRKGGELLAHRGHVEHRLGRDRHPVLELGFTVSGGEDALTVLHDADARARRSRAVPHGEHLMHSAGDGRRHRLHPLDADRVSARLRILIERAHLDAVVAIQFGEQENGLDSLCAVGAVHLRYLGTLRIANADDDVDAMLLYRNEREPAGVQRNGVVVRVAGDKIAPDGYIGVQAGGVLRERKTRPCGQSDDGKQSPNASQTAHGRLSGSAKDEHGRSFELSDDVNSTAVGGSRIQPTPSRFADHVPAARRSRPYRRCRSRDR